MPKVLSKSATLTLRIDPAVKELLSLAAEADRRSQANMVEVMVLQYCQQRGLIDQGASKLLGWSGKPANICASDTGSGENAPAQDKNQTKGPA